MPRREKADQTNRNKAAAASRAVRIANQAARAASADAEAMLKADTGPLSRHAPGAGGLPPQKAPSEPDPDELKAQAVMGRIDRDLAEIHRRIDRVLAQWNHG